MSNVHILTDNGRKRLSHVAVRDMEANASLGISELERMVQNPPFAPLKDFHDGI